MKSETTVSGGTGKRIMYGNRMYANCCRSIRHDKINYKHMTFKL